MTNKARPKASQSRLETTETLDHSDYQAVGCGNSITLLTWEFTGRLATPQWALPRLGECVLRLVQLEDATRA